MPKLQSKTKETKLLMQQLVTSLNEHAFNYYNHGESDVSDSVYDKEIRVLKKLEQLNPDLIQKDSPTQRVGAPITGGFKKHVREIPLLSLDNVFDHAELTTWLKSFKDDDEFVIEPKLDGLAIEISYREGLLMMAVTRGDGTVGDIITHNVLTMPIPNMLRNFTNIDIRGEAVITKKNFVRLKNSGIPALEKLKNARNAAAGGARAVDPAKAKQRLLSFFVYDATDLDRPQDDHWALLEALKLEGFVVSNFTDPVSKKDVLARVTALEEYKDKIACDTDGIVIKLNARTRREEVGITSRIPKWAIALKPEQEEQVTTLTSIVQQVGRTGAITPVAKIEPVVIDGVTVSSVTLHNTNTIREKDIGIGGVITVIRAGGVIPQITSCSCGEPYIPPTYCPCCDSELEEVKSALKCKNPECKDQLIEYLRNFVSRKAANIMGMGDEAILWLVNNEKIKAPHELYDIARLRSELVNGYCSSLQADNMLAGVETSRNMNFGKFIYALGILEVGDSAGRTIALHTGSLEAFLSLSVDKLKAMPDIGEITAINVMEYIEEYSDKIKLLAAEMSMVYPEKPVVRDDVLTFCITGTLTKRPRAVIKTLLLKMGHKVSGSVSKKTSVLIAGDNAGSKLAAADKLKVEVWTEDKANEYLDKELAALTKGTSHHLGD